MWSGLELADIVKLSAEELDYLADDGEDAFLERLWSGHPRLLVVTDGAAPLRWFARDAEGELPICDVRSRRQHRSRRCVRGRVAATDGRAGRGCGAPRRLDHGHSPTSCDTSACRRVRRVDRDPAWLVHGHARRGRKSPHSWKRVDDAQAGRHARARFPLARIPAPAHRGHHGVLPPALHRPGRRLSSSISATTAASTTRASAILSAARASSSTSPWPRAISAVPATPRRPATA